MSDLSSRLYQLAKGYVESARTRLDEIDQRALAELQQALPLSNSPAASADPMERAAAKIAAARAAAGYSAERPGGYQTAGPAGDIPAESADQSLSALESRASAAPPASTDPLATAYRVIGIPDGSDRAAVEDAVAKLRERCAPEKFTPGSEDELEARRILARIDEAHAYLQHCLNPEAGRFERLEL